MKKKMMLTRANEGIDYFLMFFGDKKNPLHQNMECIK